MVTGLIYIIFSLSIVANTKSTERDYAEMYNIWSIVDTGGRKSSIIFLLLSHASFLCQHFCYSLRVRCGTPSCILHTTHDIFGLLVVYDEACSTNYLPLTSRATPLSLSPVSVSFILSAAKKKSRIIINAIDVAKLTIYICESINYSHITFAYVSVELVTTTSHCIYNKLNCFI